LNVVRGASVEKREATGGVEKNEAAGGVENTRVKSGKRRDMRKGLLSLFEV
jgi:hypothetical protein